VISAYNTAGAEGADAYSQDPAVMKQYEEAWAQHYAQMGQSTGNPHSATE
jgi:hypothetical protein